jgi:hypothetical protein
VVVIVTCNCWLLTTVVLSVVPLMTTTEDETNWLPFTERTRPCCTSANVIVVGERDPITGAGRVLPQRGLSALQPGRVNNASRRAPSGRQESLIRFIRHRTSLGCREHDNSRSDPNGRLCRITYNIAICTKLASRVGTGIVPFGRTSACRTLPHSQHLTQELAQNCCSAMNSHNAIVLPNPSRVLPQIALSTVLRTSSSIPPKISPAEHCRYGTTDISTPIPPAHCDSFRNFRPADDSSVPGLFA